MNNEIPLQCGQRFKVGDDIWQVNFICLNGDMATLEKIAPEPEVPEEITNLLWGDWHKNAWPDLVEPRTGFAPFESHNAQVLEAYRRGQKSKEKP